MAKPASPTPVKSEPVFKVRDVRIVEVGPGLVDVVEVVFHGVPSVVRRLNTRPVARVVAQSDVRLYNENRLGPDRYGDSGLGTTWDGKM